MRPICRFWSVVVAAGFLRLGVPAGFGAEEGNPLIVPGKSVGEVRLGLEMPEVYKILGKSAIGEGATGRAWEAWFALKEGGGRGYELTIRSHTTATGHDKTVEAIRVESPSFRTGEGVNTGSSLADIWKAFPEARYRSTDPNDRAVEFYEDDEHGIAFEVRRTLASAGAVPPPGASWGACRAIIVFEAASATNPSGGLPMVTSMRAMHDTD